MSETKHTAPPWEVKSSMPYSHGVWEIWAEHNYIGQFSSANIDEKEAEANAKLAAAAPDMQETIVTLEAKIRGLDSRLSGAIYALMTYNPSTTAGTMLGWLSDGVRAIERLRASERELHEAKEAIQSMRDSMLVRVKSSYVDTIIPARYLDIIHDCLLHGRNAVILANGARILSRMESSLNPIDEALEWVNAQRKLALDKVRQR